MTTYKKRGGGGGKRIRLLHASVDSSAVIHQLDSMYVESKRKDRVSSPTVPREHDRVRDEGASWSA